MISNFDEYLKKYKESVESPEKFWSSYAENFKWEKKWDDFEVERRIEEMSRN